MQWGTGMLFNSIQFLVFFPIVSILYFVFPTRLRMYWLLVTSYYFYMNWNPKYALLLLFSTAATYFFGLLIDASRLHTERAALGGRKSRNWGKLWVVVCLVINLSILFFFKYFTFALDNLNAMLLWLGTNPIRPAFDVLLPVGISFYIFQALSYTIDVYRKSIDVEKNFFRYALFVSFFPQLVAGPIERSSNILIQLVKPRTFNLVNVRDGLLLMAWGFFQKIVIADRAALFVNQVFNYHAYYAGFEVLVAMLLFAVQIYCDFEGYSNIAIGSAQVMGFTLMKNFNRPYFARSISEFWRRWHISLSTWFRDYLYIPLGGSRGGRANHHINMMIVFLVSGLWHGAAWNYVIWGGLNGLYQIVGTEFKVYRGKVLDALHVRKESFSHRLLQMIITFVLVDISWVFFRAASFIDATDILRSIFVSWNPWIFFDGSLFNMGLEQGQLTLLFLAIGVLLVVSFLQERNLKLRAALARQETWFRWAIYIIMVFTLLIYGVYGPGFAASSFIYFQF